MGDWGIIRGSHKTEQTPGQKGQRYSLAHEGTQTCHVGLDQRSSKNDSDIAYWNAEADRLAGLGMRGFTSDGIVEGALPPHYGHTHSDTNIGETEGSFVTGWSGVRGPPRGGIG